MDEKVKINRRNFLSASTLAIGGVIGVSLGIPAIIYVSSPAFVTSESENWIRLGSINKIELGTPTLFKVNIQHQTGWIVDEEELSVYVITEDGREFVAMSNVCTHLGCRVRWISDKNFFFCPCHNGVFDKEGLVLDGPPPRPLDRYETKVEDESLYIKV